MAAAPPERDSAGMLIAGRSSGRRLIRGVHERLVDEAFQRYLDWRDESAALEAAYDRWSRASRDDRRFAHAAYEAALEREEFASTQYQSLLEAAERMLATS
jgi:hypothetical protein